VPQFVEFLSQDALLSEPVSVEEVKIQARIDLDLTDDDLFIQMVIIPGARQQAEMRTGSVIRPARYRQVMDGFPKWRAPISLASGNVQRIESVTYAVPHGQGSREYLDLMSTELVVIDKEAVITLIKGNRPHWPHTQQGPRAVEITYTAGTESDLFALKYPSVKAWVLMACAWGYAQREMFMLQTRGSGYQELPTEYMSALLEPLKLPPRW
jgi:hypothetical protein